MLFESRQKETARKRRLPDYVQFSMSDRIEDEELVGIVSAEERRKIIKKKSKCMIKLRQL